MKWEDAQRGLFGELLIRYFLLKKNLCKVKNIHFTKNKYGKPFIKNLPNLYFNISHSGNWVVCVIDFLPIGVDIEHIAPVDLSIAENHFSEEENTNLNKTNETEKLSYFYSLWTLKESYIKAKGKGLSIDLKSFSLKMIAHHKICFKSNLDKNSIWYFKQYHIDQNYKMAVCARHRQFPKQIVFYTPHNLIHFFC